MSREDDASNLVIHTFHGYNTSSEVTVTEETIVYFDLCTISCFYSCNNFSTKPLSIRKVYSHRLFQSNYDIVATSGICYSYFGNRDCDGDVFSFCNRSVCQFFDDVEVLDVVDRNNIVFDRESLTCFVSFDVFIGEEALRESPSLAAVVVVYDPGLLQMFLNDRALGNLCLHDILGSELQLLFYQDREVYCLDRKKLADSCRLVDEVFYAVIEHIGNLLVQFGVCTIACVSCWVCSFCSFPLFTLVVKSAKKLFFIFFNHCRRLDHHIDINHRIDVLLCHRIRSFLENVIKGVGSGCHSKSAYGWGLFKILSSCCRHVIFTPFQVFLIYHKILISCLMGDFWTGPEDPTISSMFVGICKLLYFNQVFSETSVISVFVWIFPQVVFGFENVGPSLFHRGHLRFAIT